MPFQSPLAPILRLRRLLEERKELELQLALANIATCRAEISRAELATRSIGEAATRITAPAPGVELQFIAERQQAIAELLALLRTRADAAERSAESIRHSYDELRRGRQQIETIYDRRRKEWEHRAARAEQRRIDELFLMSWYRNRQIVQPACESFADQ